MAERKKWTSQEDLKLKTIKNQEKDLNWSQIAKQMKKTFFYFKKSGKQCRERYHSHLLTTNINKQWTQQDKCKLSELHNIYGNKWAKIAELMGNRTDNCVKNYFYSSMRKSVRRMNLIASLFNFKFFKQIKFNDICIILDAFDTNFQSSNTKWTQQEARISSQIKQAMFQMSNIDIQLNGLQINIQLQQLLVKTNQFLKLGRRKLKKHNIKKNIDKTYYPQTKLKKSQFSISHTVLNLQKEQNVEESHFNLRKTQHQNDLKLTDITNQINKQNIIKFNQQLIFENQNYKKNLTKQSSNLSIELQEINYPTFRLGMSKKQSQYQNNDWKEGKSQFFYEDNVFLQPLSFKSFKSFKSYSSFDYSLFN